MKSFKPIRGTNDRMPSEAKIREIVRQKIITSYQNNGFNLISTPILENLEFLNMSDGGDNLKLMFKTIKRGEKLDLTKENLTEENKKEKPSYNVLSYQICWQVTELLDLILISFYFSDIEKGVITEDEVISRNFYD